MSFERPSSFNEQQLQSSNVSWNNIVKVSSNHLVLPALYFRLKSKELLAHLPEDLQSYMNTIATINKNRNQSLIIEAKKVTSILNNHGIQHVYIKGMATLIGGYYQDLGERMITDMDILLRTEDAQRAYHLIKSLGYSKTIDFDYEVKDFRHLPKLIDNRKLAAIELHDNILIKGKRQLINLDDLFETSVKRDNFIIPNQYYLNLINILTTQINNNNYYYNRINLKNLYDSTVLDLAKKELDEANGTHNKYVNSYLSLYNFWRPETDNNDYTSTIMLRRFSYSLKVRSRFLESIIFKIKWLYLSISKRINLLVKNKSYRNHVIKNKLLTKTKVK